jgi:hypothetical protein
MNAEKFEVRARIDNHARSFETAAWRAVRNGACAGALPRRYRGRADQRGRTNKKIDQMIPVSWRYLHRRNHITHSLVPRAPPSRGRTRRISCRGPDPCA